MSFLHPAFLWALTALVIPVLIHLFQLRRFKRIDFPNVRFLAEVSQRTRARKRVRHWLVLLARMLALAALVMAFAQPYIPGESKVVEGRRAVSLFIDDSYSMDGQNARGRLLDQARLGAQEAVMAHNATDRFQVLTGRFEGRQQVMLGRDEALEAAAAVDVGPHSRPLSKVLARQREALATDDAPVKRAFLFTDLQRSTTDVENWTNDTLTPTVIVPLASARPDNLSLDSVWFASPVRRAGQSETLRARIRNFGEQDLVNVPLRLSINGRPRALATFSVEAGATVDTALRFTGDPPGNYWGEVSLSDQPVTFDDNMHISYRVTERLRVLLVSGGDVAGDRAVAAVFAGDSVHTFGQQPLGAIDLSTLDRQDLVVLNALPEVPSGLAQALEAFVENGGSLAVFPPSNGDPAGHAALFGRLGLAPPTRMDTARVKVDRIDLEHPFYREIFQTMPRNVDLPDVRERWGLRPPPGSDVLLRLRDGTAQLAAVRKGTGTAYLWASPLAERASGLTRHALFATSLLRMAELSRPMGALYHIIGAEAMVPLEGVELIGDRVPRLRGPDGTSLVPEVRRMPGSTALVLHDEDLAGGAYAVTLDDDTVMILALNLPRTESDLAALSVEELKEALARHGLHSFTVLEEGARDLSLRLTELDRGRKLWKWFVLLALLFLAAETLLLRYAR